MMKCPHCGSNQIEKRRHLTPIGKALLVSGVIAITAGPKGTICKYEQDSTGNWHGGPWDTMPAGLEGCQ